MNFDEYTDIIDNDLRTGGFDRVDADTDGFGDVYANREKGLSIGIANVMVTAVDANDMQTGDARETTDAFRDLLGDESVAKFGIGENMFGYIVFVVESDDHELADWIGEYDAMKRNSNCFPFIFELGSKTLHTHDVPRISTKRGRMKKAKSDAEEYLDVGEDDSGGWI